MSILVLGTVALDSVKTPFGERQEILGGSAAHFSMAARIFTKVYLVSIIGLDFPPKFIKFLADKGVILSGIKKEQGNTFRWQGKYEGDCNTAITIDTQLGVLSIFKPQISKEHRVIKNIFLANVDPDIQSCLLDSMKNPRFIGLDSMNYWINTKKESLLKVIKRVHLFVANEQEARSLTGENNLVKAAAGLTKLGAKMVVIKKGEHGVIFYSPKVIFSLPAFPVTEVIDPTGAGDTFAGGLMGYLATKDKIRNSDIKQALAYATICASFNVEGFGLEKTAKLTRNYLEKRLKEYRMISSLTD